MEYFLVVGGEVIFLGIFFKVYSFWIGYDGWGVKILDFLN